MWRVMPEQKSAKRRVQAGAEGPTLVAPVGTEVDLAMDVPAVAGKSSMRLASWAVEVVAVACGCSGDGSGWCGNIFGGASGSGLVGEGGGALLQGHEILLQNSVVCLSII